MAQCFSGSLYIYLHAIHESNDQVYVVYTVELDLFFHHCMTIKVLFLILPRLNRRDEQLHHFNNEYKKLNEEVMNLRMELGREKEKCKKLEDSNKHLAEDRDQFKDR